MVALTDVADLACQFADRCHQVDSAACRVARELSRLGGRKVCQPDRIDAVQCQVFQRRVDLLPTGFRELALLEREFARPVHPQREELRIPWTDRRLGRYARGAPVDLCLEVEEKIRLVPQTLGVADDENAGPGRSVTLGIAQRVLPENQITVAAENGDACRGRALFTRGSIIEDAVLLEHIAVSPFLLAAVVAEEDARPAVGDEGVLTEDVVGVTAPDGNPGPLVAAEFVLLEHDVLDVLAHEQPGAAVAQRAVPSHHGMMGVAPGMQPEDRTVLHEAVFDGHVARRPLEADAVAAVVAHGAVADRHTLACIEVDARPATTVQGLGLLAVPVNRQPLHGRVLDVPSADHGESPCDACAARDRVILRERRRQPERPGTDLLRQGRGRHRKRGGRAGVANGHAVAHLETGLVGQHDPVGVRACIPGQQGLRPVAACQDRAPRSAYDPDVAAKRERGPQHVAPRRDPHGAAPLACRAIDGFLDRARIAGPRLLPKRKGDRGALSQDCPHRPQECPTHRKPLSGGRAWLQLPYVVSVSGTIKPLASGRVLGSGRSASARAFPDSDAGAALASCL